MSITVVRDKEVTVFTVMTDSKSMLPPLCQILKTLCCRPMWSSGYKVLMQSNAISALGTIQIMVGLFNIGLGPGRTSLHPEDFAHLGAAYWLGGMFIVAGIVSLLANRFPSPCLVGFAVLVNIVGSIFAIVGIVLYGTDIKDVSAARFCDGFNAHRSGDNCKYVQYFFQRLMTAMDITMIILTVLQLCVCVNFTALGIKALFNTRKEEGGRDDDIYQPVLKEVLMTSPGA
ncbi:high affinity immunoglobulin epsilon receptor subunit beta-like isoform X2 [Anarrhichthys ocellatus]|uniref:high affinity immunoglobulin epsilon receptor subunit beta-like isoform X2 n=1 Tax=Anarrhichthys ocellatus TaxID=433405 RepID=UPI0012EEAC43|nr:high affinity immunoglobulin epsilon receptor subunit beta-like isoform X2 [Anarrhichthys ocellatus]